MNKEFGQKVVLILLIFGIIGYLYVEYAFKPQYSAIQEQLAQIETKRLQLETWQREKNNITEHAGRVQELTEKYAELKAQIPPVLSKPHLISYLYNLAVEYQLTDGELYFEEPITEAGYIKLPLTFSGTGKVANVLAFCEAVQNSSDPRITVQALNLTSEVEAASFSVRLISYAEALGANPSSEQEFMDSHFGVPIPEAVALPKTSEAE